MTFAIIENEEPLLGQLIAIAFESEGHGCVVLKDGAHAARSLRTMHLDGIIVDTRLPDMSGIVWLETMAAIWPDLPARTLLLTPTALTSKDVARIKRLGADVAFRPLSIESVQRLVLGRLQKTASKTASKSRPKQKKEGSLRRFLSLGDATRA